MIPKCSYIKSAELFNLCLFKKIKENNLLIVDKHKRLYKSIYVQNYKCIC